MQQTWLDNIKQFEQTPPISTWDIIANSLEATTSNSLKTKMYNFDIHPPEQVFINVFETLNKKQAKLVSVKKTYFKIVAAAAILFFAITTFNHLNTENKKTSQVVVNEQPIIKEVAETSKNIEDSISTIAAVPNKLIAKNNTKIISAKNNESTKTKLQFIQKQDYIKSNEVASLASNPTENANEKLLNTNGEAPIDIALINTPNNYINAPIGPNGQMVRVSSKFSNIVGYLSDNNQPNTQENLDIIIAESAKWKAIFAAWRQQMSNNTIAPLLSNFMDIIELSKMLEPKK